MRSSEALFGTARDSPDTVSAKRQFASISAIDVPVAAKSALIEDLRADMRREFQSAWKEFRKETQRELEQIKESRPLVMM